MYHLGLTLAISCLRGKKSQTIFNVDRPVKKKWFQIKVQELSPFLTYHWLIWTTYLPPPPPPPILDQLQNDIIKKITINLAESHQIEKITVRQSLEPEWLFQRSERLTASNFGKVIKKKKTSHWIFSERHICSKGFIEGIIHSSWKTTGTPCQNSVQQKNAENVQAIHCSWCWAGGEPLFPLPWGFPRWESVRPHWKKNPFGLLEIKILTHGETTQWRKPARIQTSAFIW